MLLQVPEVVVPDVIPLQGRRSLQLATGHGVLCTGGSLMLRLPPLWLGETSVPRLIRLYEGEHWLCEEAVWLLIEACSPSSSFTVQPIAAEPGWRAGAIAMCQRILAHVCRRSPPACAPKLPGQIKTRNN